MTYERSLSGKEQKKVEFCGAIFMSCFVVAFILCTIFKPYLGPLPLMNLEQSVGFSLKMVRMSTEERSRPQQLSEKNIINPSFTNLSNSRSQVYELNGDIRIHGNSSTIYIASTTPSQQHIPRNWTTTPYARLGDRVAMKKSKTFNIIFNHHHHHHHCRRRSTVPAILFSTGGYAGNPFHDFTDMLVPLYLTSHQLNRSVVFLVSDNHSWWTSKYKIILNNLSEHEIVDIDGQGELWCFTRVIVGLKAHKELGIDPAQSPHESMGGFREFLRSTYSLEHRRSTRRPRLLIVSRRKTRHLVNEAEVADVARGLGFNVVVREMWWQVASVAKFVNGFDVMVGVHGAGLTNMVFLPENGVVIQIVPIGLERLSRMYFQVPAKDMRLRYLEYKVSMNESSLAGKYRALDGDVNNRGWHDFRSVYLDNQDVSVDLGRFRGTLLEALELVRT
ncbi:protein o-linked-mannose beta-1 4-n-acetylglucosaminyltransferase 2 [Phtheirospermum japonicum]|uniref:Protein o-linked-mannose beta-1 4-n-acetylglucosaminyltransferase 2 n=1 Tax=Phtheirospermum japonicum TaxID=374723 RepID=A0A830BNU2_9LAMI|nr:protein o-linked-mannose beta-1 4-n-acetylglucosaminyltransferase 2 [Phtheirospermum japonicum]